MARFRYHPYILNLLWAGLSLWVVLGNALPANQVVRRTASVFRRADRLYGRLIELDRRLGRDASLTRRKSAAVEAGIGQATIARRAK